jgi:catechol 2,3-dioxygenase-like lactoylglutathione lyase family enzyme
MSRRRCSVRTICRVRDPVVVPSGDLLWDASRSAFGGRTCSMGERPEIIATMGVRRVVPDLASRSLDAAKGFYSDVLGLQTVMDQGWIITLADPERPAVQLSLMTHDETAPVIPSASIQVDDVDASHAAAVQAGAEIVYPLTDEPWGVRRFFVRDPDGHVINVLSHL